LGVEPYVDEAYYVGFRVGDLAIGLDPRGHNQGMTGPVGYWQVDDIKKNLQLVLGAGAQLRQEVRDVGGGKLIATVTDADGNVIPIDPPPFHDGPHGQVRRLFERTCTSRSHGMSALGNEGGTVAGLVHRAFVSWLC